MTINVYDLVLEDGASGSDDEHSTTSSGRGPGLVLRMRDRPYRFTHRDHSREPLVKLESKTFDEGENFKQNKKS